MNHLTTPTDRPAAAREEATLLPPVDVIEDGTGITLYADLPGVPRDRLGLRVEGDRLTIEAEMVAASVMKPAPVTPLAPFEVSIVTNRRPIC